MAATVVVPCNAQAADYPDKPIHFIVGFAPGGGTDMLARLIGQKLSEKWGQPVIVENRPGADGSIAADVVAHTKPDGYSLAWISNGHTITPSERKLSYDPIKDFAPIIEVASTPDVLLVDPTLPVNSLPELIALAKSKPGQLNWGSGGFGVSPYLEMSLLIKLTGMNMVHVNYKGGAETMRALLGGEISVEFGSLGTVIAQIKAGKLKPLAVSSQHRSRDLPDLPTVTEAANLDGFDGNPWYGVLAPAGTPDEVVTKLNTDMAAIIALPDVQHSIIAQGYDPVADSPGHFTHTISADIARWADLLKGIDIPK